MVIIICSDAMWLLHNVTTYALRNFPMLGLSPFITFSCKKKQFYCTTKEEVVTTT